MSVYKRKGGSTYIYDFQVAGDRFYGDTGKTSKREARAYEDGLREKAKADAKKRGAQRVALDAPRTWGQASTRWYNEIGQHHKALDLTLIAQEWLSREIGPDRLLTEIDDNFVARLVAKRRAQKRRVGKQENREKQRRVSAATVNRTVTEPLRKVLLRARKVWKVPVAEVNWSQHLLSEPKERVREASRGEEAAVLGRLGRGYEEAVRFAFDNGLRRMELLALKKSQVDFFTDQITVIGKGGKERIIAMSAKARAQLWRLRNTPTEFVFTFTAARTRSYRGTRYVKGEHYPLTEHGLRSAWRRAIAGAGVPNLRPHDARHTAATRTLRVSNIRVVQNLLGHEDVKTTAKYAHAMVEDMRAALDAASPAESPGNTDSGDAKLLGENKNAG